MAAGQGPTIAGWHLFSHTILPGITPGACGADGLLTADGACPAAVVQPTVVHGNGGGSWFVAAEGPWKLAFWRVSKQLTPAQTVEAGELSLLGLGHLNDPDDAPQKGGSPTNLIAIGNLGNTPLKAVWRAGFLFVVLNDASGLGQAHVRVLRLPTSQFPVIPIPPDAGARQIMIGKTGLDSSYGWPAIEVNQHEDAGVVYTRTGPSSFAGIRYNAWIFDEPTMRGGRMLKAGEATERQPTDGAIATRWGDLAGASVDFVDGKEADGIWIVHEYARIRTNGSTTDGTCALWVGKVFGK